MPSPVQNLECSWGVKWYQVALVLCDDMDHGALMISIYVLSVVLYCQQKYSAKTVYLNG